MRRRLATLLLLVTMSVIPAEVATAQGQPAGHGSYTDARVEGDTVVIVVNLIVIYALSEDAGPPDPESVKYVNDGFAAAQKFWNDAFDRIGGCPKLRLELNIVFSTEEGSGALELDGHVVQLYEHWRSGAFPDGRGLPSVVFPGLKAADVPGDQDVAYPFDDLSVAYFPAWLFEDPWALAHELGHLFGLGDDYRDGEVIPGREGTLMGGTLGGDYVDQSILSDIANIAKQAGYQLPECWAGTTVIDNEGLCTVRWSVTLAVNAEGDVTGRVEVESDSCGGGISGDMTGTKTEEGFMLTGPTGVGRALPITGGNTATGTFHPHPITTETWDLECKTCEE